jgi:hypothetical protein
VDTIYKALRAVWRKFLTSVIAIDK